MGKWGLLHASLLFVLVSCAPAPTPTSGGVLAGQLQGEKLSATVLHNTLQCGGGAPKPTAIWISDLQQLNQHYRQISQSAPETLTLPTVDFVRESVLLISMGQRPSGGYLLNYQEQPIHFKDDTLNVEVLWQEPVPGYKQAQVITTPCLLLKLPVLENVRQIKIWDQDGEIKLDITV